MLKQKIEKYIEKQKPNRERYVMKNPKNSSDRSWVYNIFFKKIYDEEKEEINKKKVNWLLNLTPIEKEILEERGANLKKVDSNNSKSEKKRNSLDTQILKKMIKPFIKNGIKMDLNDKEGERVKELFSELKKEGEI